MKIYAYHNSTAQLPHILLTIGENDTDARNNLSKFIGGHAASTAPALSNDQLMQLTKAGMAVFIIEQAKK